MKISIIAAYAGRAIRTPKDNPANVVSANPFNSPAPAQNNGSMEAKTVKYAPVIINMAFFILRFQSEASSFFPRTVSSVMTTR